MIEHGFAHLIKHLVSAAFAASDGLDAQR